MKSKERVSTLQSDISVRGYVLEILNSVDMGMFMSIGLQQLSFD